MDERRPLTFSGPDRVLGGHPEAKVPGIGRDAGFPAEPAPPGHLVFPGTPSGSREAASVHPAEHNKAFGM